MGANAMNKSVLWMTLGVCGAGALFVACASDESAKQADAPKPDQTEPATQGGAAEGTRTKGAAQKAEPEAPAPKSGIDLTRFDKNVRPADDFYRYVNGTWLKEFEIPADKSNYGTFTKLADESEKNLKVIIDEAAATTAEAGTEQQKVGDAFKSFMGEAKIDELGVSPLEAERKKIAAIKTHDDVVEMFGRHRAMGLKSPLTMWVSPDLKNSTSYIVYLSQSGLGLPDRDYYLKPEKKFADTRVAYQAHVEKLLVLAGDKPKSAAKKAKQVFDLEKKLADKQWARADNRDRDKTYNKKTSKELAKLSKLKWTRFFDGLGLAEAGRAEVIVFQPPYAKALGSIVKKTPVKTWKTYLEVRLLDGYAPYLSKDFSQAHYEFHEKTITGAPEPRPRWKRGVAFVEDALGEALGKIYVERHFKPEAKARMEKLVGNLKTAFLSRVEKLDWMGDETKAAAKTKLSKFTTKIGYPDQWRDYSTLEIKPEDLVGNVMRANTFETKRGLNKLGKPIDRGEWFMTPQTINAYYNATMNEIVFPAAILQPPFFNLEADDAVNYGAIGAVIGHEIGHGFDDQGRKSDGDGNLRDWWTEEDATRFKKRADRLVEQYDGYNPIDDLKVNGRLTLGENIGDLGGMNIAWAAYQLSLEEGGERQEPPVIDGFTGPQRFFIGWSQIWGRKYRDEELRRRLVIDSHSPSEYRVIGVMSNLPPFYEAFGVKEGDKLWLPEDKRVQIW